MKDMDYILLLDADMVLTGHYMETKENAQKFKTILSNKNVDLYYMCQGTPTYFYKNVRIVKNHKDFAYWGVTHEYVTTPPDTTTDSIENGELFINDIGDGGSKTDKFERDIRLLKKGLEEIPDNDRYTFYLANSYRDAGHSQEAIDTYRKRIQIGGWIEETWQSYYNIGICYKRMGETEKALNAWLEGYDHHPKRIENLYEIIHHYRCNGKNRLAYFYYTLAERSRRQWGASNDYLFLQKDIYDYKIDYELSIVGYYVNEDNYDLLKTSMKVLSYPYVEDHIQHNVLSNYKFYTKRLVDLSVPLPDSMRTLLENATKALQIHSTEENETEYVSSTPSLCKHKDLLYVNVRYVNYRIDDNGNYVNRDKICTKNAITIINSEWKVLQEFELKYDRMVDDYYEGLEDVRLFSSGDEVLYNANRGLPNGNMTIEHGKIDRELQSTYSNVWLKNASSPGSKIEKNWILIPKKGTTEMKAIYHWSPALIVGDIQTDSFVETHRRNVPTFFKYLRGSTNGILVNNELWVICHAVSYEDRRYYYHILVILDADTFDVKRYTPFFTFEGAKVEYTLGMVHMEDTDTLLIGYSLYDKETKYMSVKRSVFENMCITL
jgi:tetratricopeptide (TPR) repeat protein